MAYNKSILSLMPKYIYQREIKPTQGGGNHYSMMRVISALGFAFFERLLGPHMRQELVPIVWAALEEKDRSIFPAFTAVHDTPEVKDFIKKLKKTEEMEDNPVTKLESDFSHLKQALWQIFMEVLAAPHNPDNLFTPDISKIGGKIKRFPDSTSLETEFDDSLFELFSQLMHCPLIVYKITRDAKINTVMYGTDAVITKPISVLVAEPPLAKPIPAAKPNPAANNTVVAILYPQMNAEEEGLNNEDLSTSFDNLDQPYIDMLTAESIPESNEPAPPQALAEMEKQVADFNQSWMNKLRDVLNAHGQGHSPTLEDLKRLNDELYKDARNLIEILRTNNRNDLEQHVAIPPFCMVCHVLKPDHIRIQCGVCSICKNCLVV